MAEKTKTHPTIERKRVPPSGRLRRGASKTHPLRSPDEVFDLRHPSAQPISVFTMANVLKVTSHSAAACFTCCPVRCERTLSFPSFLSQLGHELSRIKRRTIPSKRVSKILIHLLTYLLTSSEIFLFCPSRKSGTNPEQASIVPCRIGKIGRPADVWYHSTRRLLARSLGGVSRAITPSLARRRRQR